MWRDWKIVHGKPRHFQSQHSVERANQNVENMLATFLQKKKKKKKKLEYKEKNGIVTLLTLLHT